MVASSLDQGTLGTIFRGLELLHRITAMADCRGTWKFTMRAGHSGLENKPGIMRLRA